VCVSIAGRLLTTTIVNIGPNQTESGAEENVEQDDAMENSNDENVNSETTKTYVSHYPDTRRYSVANAMSATTTRRPQYKTDNQGYSIDVGDQESGETKINIPTSQPPQYSAVIGKVVADNNKVKVCVSSVSHLNGNPISNKLCHAKVTSKHFRHSFASVLLCHGNGKASKQQQIYISKASVKGFQGMFCDRKFA